jgi:hypothetical protein
MQGNARKLEFRARQFKETSKALNGWEAAVDACAVGTVTGWMRLRCGLAGCRRPSG